ncbi:MAG TPA: hypothetical protein VGP93_12155 [Polyangiaceae bacterium]|nr:hypothetical protein [Polyangiaceae bacterium]
MWIRFLVFATFGVACTSGVGGAPVAGHPAAGAPSGGNAGSLATGATGGGGGAGAASSGGGNAGSAGKGGSAGEPTVNPLPPGEPGFYLASDEVWPNPIPSGGPDVSTDFVDAVFTGRHIEYTQSDTWYPSWAADGDLYTNFADGNVNGVGIGSIGDNANTGRVKITGDDPLSLVFVNAHKVYGAPGAGYDMRYPAGNLVANGVWYSATNLRNSLGVSGCAYTCTQGALVGFDVAVSPASAVAETDWVKTSHTASDPLFPETGLGGQKVKFGEPHFVDFGQDLKYSPDGKAYLVGHGAQNPEDFVNWNAGSDIYLARVQAAPDTINDLGQWEFYKGTDALGEAIWSSGFSELAPILSWPAELGNVSITYDPALERYVMTFSRNNKVPDDWNRSDFFVLHSAGNSLTSGWKMLRVWHDFGTFGYMPNVPSKFVSQDGATFWMGFSTDNGHRAGTVSNPAGAQYSYDLREVRLVAAASGDGAVSGSVSDDIAGVVDLSAEGTSDWAHWGQSGFPSEDRKQGTSAIQMTSALCMYSGVTKKGDSSGLSSFSWTGGSPTASATAAASGVSANDTNSGFTLSVPADTSPRTLKVYVGVSRAQGELHAYLSDNSATPYRDGSISDSSAAHNGVYTLSYQAASADQTLYVTWANARDFSTDFTDKVLLYAATLSGP